MPQTNVDNSYDPGQLRESLLELRRDGWKVKFIYAKQLPSMPGDLLRFRANKKHVNLRGERGHHRIGPWNNSLMINGWLFKIYVRNENGGYTLDHQIQDLEEAVTICNRVIAQESPVIPTWDRNDLPEPFPLPDQTEYKYVEADDWSYDAKYNRTKLDCVQFECLTEVISSLGIVSISPDCAVNMDAAAVPGNRAWFLLRCIGTAGKLLLVTDGEHFYPVSKRGQKFKISLTLRTKRADFASLTARDTERLRMAIGVFANKLAEEHT